MPSASQPCCDVGMATPDLPPSASWLAETGAIATERNSAAGPLTYTVTDPASPITAGLNGFAFNDEAFYLMTWAKNPQMHVLATVALPAGRAPISVVRDSNRLQAVSSLRPASRNCAATYFTANSAR